MRGFFEINEPRDSRLFARRRTSKSLVIGPAVMLIVRAAEARGGKYERSPSSRAVLRSATASGIMSRTRALFRAGCRRFVRSLGDRLVEDITSENKCHLATSDVKCCREIFHMFNVYT